MDKDEFNRKAAEYCELDSFDMNNWHDASRFSNTMSIKVRPAFHSSCPIDPKERSRGHRVAIKVMPNSELVSREATTRPMAVCRCIAAILGWGEIGED